MSLFSIFLKGGPLMWVLLAVSVAAVGIIIKKYRQILGVNKTNLIVENELGTHADIDNLIALCDTYQDSIPLTSVLCRIKGIINEDFNLIKESTEASANLAIHKLEKGLGWLSTISAVAPLIGFLGTVTGMVKVFMNIQARSSEGIDITYLAGGIWEALLTTVGGLIIGIISIIFYNDLVQQIEDNSKFLQEKLDGILIKIKHQRDIK